MCSCASQSCLCVRDTTTTIHEKKKNLCMCMTIHLRSFRDSQMHHVKRLDTSFHLMRECALPAPSPLLIAERNVMHPVRL